MHNSGGIPSNIGYSSISEGVGKINNEKSNNEETDGQNNITRRLENLDNNFNEKDNYSIYKSKKKKNKIKKLLSNKINKKRLLDGTDIINNQINDTKSENQTEEKKEEEEEEEDEEDPLEAMYERMMNKPYFDIKFRGHILHRLDNRYCVYNKNLIYISYAIVILLFILLVILFFLNTRKYNTLLFRILGYILTNTINIIIRPFFIAIVTILVN